MILRRSTLAAGMLAAFCLMSALSTGALAQARIALVIGNARYQHADPLPNPSRDAKAIGDVLGKIGFTTDVRTDLDQRGMQEALRDFGLKAESSEIALVYYAGHGIQVQSENYLLPVDAQLARERDLIYEALPLQVVIGEVAQAQRLGMVILDACRDNPLAENLRRALGPIRSQHIGQGLARVEDLPGNTLIAFSTRFDQVATDGDGELSPYTTALVDSLQEPGLELNMMFRQVRDRVLATTAYRQEPRTIDALGAEPFYFVEARVNQSPQLPDAPQLSVQETAQATPLGVGMPSDPDQDAMTVQVMGLPRIGAVKTGQRPVQFGDQLTLEQLNGLTYEPTPGSSGDAGAFLFVVRDGQGGITTGRVPIVVTAANAAPQVEAKTILQLPPIPLGLKKPVDPDGDPLTVTVTRVPTIGTVKNGDQPVKAGDQLTPDQLAGLVLDARQGASGAFGYEVADSRGSKTSAELELGIPIGPATAAVAPPPAAAEPPPSAAEPPPTIVAERTLTPGPAAEPQPAPSSAYEAPSAVFETTLAANLREGPDVETARVDSLDAGARVKVLAKAEGRNWYRVQTEEGVVGYIFGRLLKQVDDSASAPATATATLPEATPDLAAPAPAPETQVAALESAHALALGSFKDCAGCPEMVRLPAGGFAMGAKDGDRSEQPVHQVTLERPFAIGKFEVTAAEWALCVADGACPALRDTDERAAARNVSWSEAAGYAEWLSGKTGKSYRLPSEAEWEYAARAGSSSRFWWGDELGEGRANCADCGGAWDRKHPLPIGSFGANGFGLADMLGGASEWVADCWAADYKKAPATGAARDEANCSQRVLRGGSWRSTGEEIGVSSRLGYDATVRYYTNGFRVVRDGD